MFLKAVVYMQKFGGSWENPFNLNYTFSVSGKSLLQSPLCQLSFPLTAKKTYRQCLSFHQPDTCLLTATGHARPCPNDNMGRKGGINSKETNKIETFGLFRFSVHSICRDLRAFPIATESSA